MSTLKGITVALAIVAVATHPVAAMAMPCCCRDRPELERTCWRSTEARAVHGEHACCVKKHQVPEGVELSNGCCCDEARRAATPARETLAQQEAKGQPLAFAADALIELVELAPVPRRLDDVPGRFSLSGPRLLALYCTWLK